VDEIRIAELVTSARSEQKEIIVVMGLGTIGALMAAIVADTREEKGKSTKFVIAYESPTSDSFWKIPLVNQGKNGILEAGQKTGHGTLDRLNFNIY
jgi:hypothetical protein